MADHRVEASEQKTWPGRESTSQRVKCDACRLDLKVVGIGVDEAIEAIIAAHERTSHA